MNFFIASQINLGPLVLSTSLLYIIIGIAAGSLLLYLITKNSSGSRKIASDLITNFLLIVILGWKLLPVLLAPGDIISNPVSILYSSGGIPGMILGIGLGSIYLGIKLFLYAKHSVGTDHELSLGKVLKPIVLFFTAAVFISSLLFFVSWIVRQGNPDNYSARIPQPGAATGDMAPAFELSDINGELISLNDYRGKWIIINFWATWCPPCRGELPTLIRFYEHADKKKVVLLGINATGTERPKGGETIRSYISTFVTEKEINYEILLDTESKVSSIYGAVNLPTTVIVSPGGIITKIKTGVVDSFWLRSATVK